MWVLEVLSSDGSVSQSILLAGLRCSVGRSKGDITFPTDRTVSRQHGLFVLTPASSVNEPPSLFIVDCKSASGVLVGKVRVPPNVEVKLEDGSIVSFGIHKESHSKVRVVLQGLKLCATRLDRSERDLLKADCVALSKLGIYSKMEEDVKKCTHLLCNKFTVTAKSLGAIVFQKPLVVSSWLRMLREMVESLQVNPEGDAVRVLTLPLETREHITPGMDTHSVAGIDRSRNSILKGVMVILSVPSNDVYQSVISGCGAIVVKTYGNESIGTNTSTLPQMLDGSTQFSEQTKAPHTNSSSQAPAVQSRLNISVLSQKIRRHIKQAGGVSSVSCCFFLENLSDVNKELLTLAKSYGIGFLEPSGLASGIFACVTPAITSRDDLRNKIAGKSITDPAVLLPPPLPKPIEAKVAAVIENNKNKDCTAIAKTVPVPLFVPPVVASDQASCIYDIEKTAVPSVTVVAKSANVSSNDADMITADWGDEQDTIRTAAKSCSSKRLTKMFAMESPEKNEVSKMVAERVLQPSSRFFDELADVEVDDNDDHLQISPKVSQTSRLSGRNTPSNDAHAKISILAEEIERARRHSTAPPVDDGWMTGATATVLKIHPPLQSAQCHVETVATVPQEKANLCVKPETAVENMNVDIPRSPVVEERTMLLTAHALEYIHKSSGESSGGALISATVRNVKRFKKNMVRGVHEPTTNRTDIAEIQVSGKRRPVFSVKDMDRVLPKESERELQLRLEVESFQKKEKEDDEMMFAERFGGRAFKKLKVGFLNTSDIYTISMLIRENCLSPHSPRSSSSLEARDAMRNCISSSAQEKEKKQKESQEVATTTTYSS